jgi:hypothetical protein
MIRTPHGTIRCDTPAELAAALLHWLREQGAGLTVNADGYLHVDLNPCPAITSRAEAERMAAVILGLTAELKDLLAAEQTVN